MQIELTEQIRSLKTKLRVSTKANVIRRINDKLIEQIQVILTIEDSKRVINQTKSNIYIEVLLNLMRSRNKYISNEIFDMIELQS